MRVCVLCELFSQESAQVHVTSKAFLWKFGAALQTDNHYHLSYKSNAESEKKILANFKFLFVSF